MCSVKPLRIREDLGPCLMAVYAPSGVKGIKSRKSRLSHFRDVIIIYAKTKWQKWNITWVESEVPFCLGFSIVVGHFCIPLLTIFFVRKELTALGRVVSFTTRSTTFALGSTIDQNNNRGAALSPLGKNYGCNRKPQVGRVFLRTTHISCM